MTTIRATVAAMTELYRRWLLELWHGSYDVAEEILTEDFAGHWPDREVEGRDALVGADPRHPRDVPSRSSSSSRSARSSTATLVAARWTGGRPAPPRATTPLLGQRHPARRDGRFAEYWVAVGAMHARISAARSTS